jgi:general secretion pathway protein L
MGDTKPARLGNRRKAAAGQVVPVPSEPLLILALTLPRLAAHQRPAAALFAAEPHLAQPLEEMQVVLGPQLGPDPAAPWLAVFMSKTAYQALMAAQSGSRSRLVPDALLLPRPPEGQWSVAHQTTRFLARLPDGTGFAADEAGFRAIWAQSGRPALSWHHGTPLPDLAVSAQTNLPMPPAPQAPLTTFDLAQDRLPDWRRPSRLAALAAVLLLGLAVSLGLLAFDAHRLTLAAAASEAQVRQALSDRGIPVGTSVDAEVAQVLHSAEAGRSPGFLAQLSFAFDALADLSGSVTLQDISYDNRSGRLSMTLIAPELGTLQQASTLLTEAGFKTDLGTSTLNDGQARATVNLTRIGAAG